MCFEPPNFLLGLVRKHAAIKIENFKTFWKEFLFGNIFCLRLRTNISHRSLYANPHNHSPTFPPTIDSSSVSPVLQNRYVLTREQSSDLGYGIA